MARPKNSPDHKASAELTGALFTQIKSLNPWLGDVELAELTGLPTADKGLLSRYRTGTRAMHADKLAEWRQRCDALHGQKLGSAGEIFISRPSFGQSFADPKAYKLALASLNPLMKAMQRVGEDLAFIQQEMLRIQTEIDCVFYDGEMQEGQPVPAQLSPLDIGLSTWPTTAECGNAGVIPLPPLAAELRRQPEVRMQLVEREVPAKPSQAMVRLLKLAKQVAAEVPLDPDD
jgi:hypothetical protein